MDKRAREEIVQVIKDEMRTLGLYRGLASRTLSVIPPPHDIDAEASILSNMLDGGVVSGELAPLSRRHFFLPFHEMLFVVLGYLEGLAITTEAVCDGIKAAGFKGPFEKEVETIWYGQPYLSTPRILELSDRVISLWEARRLLGTMKLLEIKLRLGQTTAHQVISEIAAFDPSGVEPSQPSEPLHNSEPHSQDSKTRVLDLHAALTKSRPLGRQNGRPDGKRRGF